MVGERKFRKDLLYRLRSVVLEIPSLRDRREDIKDIAIYHVEHICQRYKLEPKGFSADFLDALTYYSWPGNVRELLSALSSSISESGSEPILFFKHLPENIRIEVARASVAFEGRVKKPEGDGLERGDGKETLMDYREFRRSVLQEPERKYLQDLMAVSKGSIKEACQVSGLSRTHLYNLLKKYNINRLGWS
jgi:two-component system NtrC family response regulator